MVTIDELAVIPLFSGLQPAELERLAKTSADIHLAAGEYAVHEGEERAIYVVLAGKIEVTKVIDGVERTIGWRAPPQYFGEVPITLGTPFPGSYRASQASRVMRVEARQYYAIAAASPEISVKVGALARERIGGLQGIAAAAGGPAHRRRTSMGHGLPRVASVPRAQSDRFRLDDARRTGIARAMASAASGGRRLPGAAARRRHDAQTSASPRDSGRVGLQTRARAAEYDTVIVGGGPAGLAAAVYGASEGLRTLVVEREAPGGQAGTSSRIENYLGFPNGVSGDELAGRALQQARRLGAEILVTRNIERIDAATRAISLDGNEVLRARTVILATGVAWRRPAIDGFDRLVGKGIYFGAARSEAAARGLDVHLIGAGNSPARRRCFSPITRGL